MHLVTSTRATDHFESKYLVSMKCDAIWENKEFS